MRALAGFAIHAQLHCKIVGVRDFIRGHDPWSERTERVDAFTKAEHAGFHFPSLNIAGSNVVENHVSTDVIVRFFRGEMFAGLLQYDSKFQLVVQFRSEMFWINYRFVRPDDGVDVLEKYNPGHDGMGKSRLG